MNTTHAAPPTIQYNTIQYNTIQYSRCNGDGHVNAAFFLRHSTKRCSTSLTLSSERIPWSFETKGLLTLNAECPVNREGPYQSEPSHRSTKYLNAHITRHCANVLWI